MLITRTINKYKATAFILDLDADGNPVKENLGEVEFTGTSASTAAARKAFKDHGISLPKGKARITVDELESKTYGCTLDAFLTVASEM